MKEYLVIVRLRKDSEIAARAEFDSLEEAQTFASMRTDFVFKAVIIRQAGGTSKHVKEASK